MTIVSREIRYTHAWTDVEGGGETHRYAGQSVMCLFFKRSVTINFAQYPQVFRIIFCLFMLI